VFALLPLNWMTYFRSLLCCIAIVLVGEILPIRSAQAQNQSAWFRERVEEPSRDYNTLQLQSQELRQRLEVRHRLEKGRRIQSILPRLYGRVQSTDSRSIGNGSKAAGDTGNLSLAGRWAEGPTYVGDVQDEIAYFNEGGYFRIVDFSDPANPNELGRMLLPAIPEDIEVNGQHAYIAGVDGLRVVSVSESGDPTEAGSYDERGRVEGVSVSGSYALIITSADDVCVIDVSSPENPENKGCVNLDDPPKNTNILSEIETSGEYAYVANNQVGYNLEGGFHVVDFSDPNNPLEVASLDTGDRSRGVAVVGDYAYVADFKRGLRMVDVSDPSNPEDTGSLDLDDAFTVNINSVDDRLYVKSIGTRIVDASNPSNPKQTGAFNAYFVSAEEPDTTHVSYGGELRVADLSDPANPETIGRSRTGIKTPTADVTVAGDYAYVAAEEGGS